MLKVRDTDSLVTRKETTDDQQDDPAGDTPEERPSPVAVRDVETVPNQAVYMDSPVLSAVNQIRPFFESGAYGKSDTPLLLRHRALIRMQRLFSRLPSDLDVRPVSSGANGTRFPLRPGGVLFYPYNSQSNLETVANRSFRHVLTLHGESNKGASVRPAARMYDYVSIAGPLARDRYLEAGIFTASDVDQGRLVMMGDTFVQSMPWIKPMRITDTAPVIFYSPTWEGYGGEADNYSSVVGLRGFMAVLKAACALDLHRVVVKPHPYLGMLRPAMVREFISGIRLLRRSGLQVAVVLRNASLQLRFGCHTQLSRLVTIEEDDSAPVAVALALCDISGMEAIFLKQRIRHMVLARESDVPRGLETIYEHKSIMSHQDPETAVMDYLNGADETDAAHRKMVFGWQNPELEGMSASSARRWMIDYVGRDPFWSQAKSI
ncbi:hypothetical protein [Shimia sp. MIT910701]|uniref:hypothetical protein n=1 Tax=Shimia sp. MIT910701 TaxID=3096987 RepID=UPI0039998C8A